MPKPAERLKSVTSEDIRNRKWTKKERETVRRLAARQAAGDDSDINFDDIPPLTEEQLASMVRFRDVRRKVSVSVRLDPQVLEWLKSKGEGHLTRINDWLRSGAPGPTARPLFGRTSRCDRFDDHRRSGPTVAGKSLSCGPSRGKWDSR